MFVLLRSRVGIAVQAIRDDEHAAASVGVRVMAAKRLMLPLRVSAVPLLERSGSRPR